MVGTRSMRPISPGVRRPTREDPAHAIGLLGVEVAVPRVVDEVVVTAEKQGEHLEPVGRLHSHQGAFSRDARRADPRIHHDSRLAVE